MSDIAGAHNGLHSEHGPRRDEHPRRSPNPVIKIHDLARRSRFVVGPALANYTKRPHRNRTARRWCNPSRCEPQNQARR